jgi:signal transduction histidine kinase
MHTTMRMPAVPERTSGMAPQGAASRTFRDATAAPLLLAALFVAAIAFTASGTGGGMAHLALAVVLVLGGAATASGLRRDIRGLVTSYQRALDDGQRLRERAECACRSRDDLLRSLGRDLRAPLNAILGWTVLLQRCPDDPVTVRRATETIDRSARAQSRLVDELEALPRSRGRASSGGSPRFPPPTLDGRGRRPPS